MKQVFVCFLLFVLCLSELTFAQAQDFKECQNQYERLLVTFNQSFEENNPLLIRTSEYQRALADLQKKYQEYHKLYYNPADSIQKLTNEAALNVLAGNYGKSLRLLGSVDSLSPQSTYYVGLLHLLNRNFDQAIVTLSNTDASKWSAVNALAAYGQKGEVTNGLSFAQTKAVGNTKGKWNYNLGLLYKLNQQDQEAVDNLNVAIRQEDNGIAYRLLRGDVLMHFKQPKRAVSDFEKVAKRHPKAQIRYANALLEVRRYQEARAVFEAYLEAEDRQFRKEAFLGLAHTYYALSRFEEAQKYYRLAATMMRDSPVALCGQANVLVTKHKYAEALSIYDRIIQADSSYLSAYLGRGVAHFGKKNYEQSLTDFSKAESLFDDSNPQLADLYVCRGFARYYTRKAGEAMVDFETALRLDGARYEAMGGISGVLIDQKNYSQAGQYLSRALNYEKNYDQMWSNYGNLLLHFDMFKKGYQVFQKAIALNPENIKAQNGWGIVLLENDQLDQSLARFDSLVAANPTIPYLLNNRGIVNAYHGNRSEQKRQLPEADASYERAFSDFSNAMQSAPLRKFYNVNQGNVYRYWEKYDEAKLSYQTYQDKSALNNTAVLYAGQEQLKDAKYYLGVALQLDSAHHVFQFNMNLLVKGKQKELARAVASAGDDGPFSDIGIKYSRDGFVTIYLYDYEYDTLHFPGRHYLPLPVAEFNEDYFIPEYDFKLLPYSEKKTPVVKTKKQPYKSQKVRLKRRGNRRGTKCPVF
ncbi:tetratricopeptide repeat protein [Arundinibacter roseus]|uniref:Tetratricopeptide repeat protein n=1 Tax=Arundinibacter roseus TaxID=2070510 RepID=A0A4R4KG96_9BACT|nr:tetratricopeptide repeat protein [Arundinibacter roseus]TDB67067.1 tetratricopeptide repeat protein [Arundinibacter roseus]